MSIIHTKAIALELKRSIKLIWAKLYDYVKGQIGQNMVEQVKGCLKDATAKHVSYFRKFLDEQPIPRNFLV